MQNPKPRDNLRDLKSPSMGTGTSITSAVVRIAHMAEAPHLDLARIKIIMSHAHGHIFPHTSRHLHASWASTCSIGGNPPTRMDCHTPTHMRNRFCEPPIG